VAACVVRFCVFSVSSKLVQLLVRNFQFLPQNQSGEKRKPSREESVSCAPDRRRVQNKPKIIHHHGKEKKGKISTPGVSDEDMSIP
jgi:hypothetical protein